VLNRELRSEYDSAVQSEQLEPAQRSALAGLAPPELPAGT
jgi:hypothetical protein